MPRSGCPALSGFGSVTSLLDGVTRMRVWQASSDRWRVDVLTDVGERDTYQTPHGSYIWDSGTELLTEVLGRYPVRLPRAADLVPPSLALRLLHEAGPRARVSELPPRRVAGVAAAGLRLIPGDPASTVEHIDIWAEPGSGLPLQVEVFGRDNGQPALETQFLQVSSWHPVGRGADPAARSRHRLHPDRCGRPVRRAGRPRPGDPPGHPGRPGPARDADRIRPGRNLRPGPGHVRGPSGQREHRAAPDQRRALRRRDLDQGPARDRGGRQHPADHRRPAASQRRASGTFVLAGFVDRQLLERAATQLAAEPW